MCFFPITWALQYVCIVPRVRFLFINKKIAHFRTDFRQILSSKPHNFSQIGPIYFISSASQKAAELF